MNQLDYKNKRDTRLRFYAFYGVVILVMTIITLRLFSLQIIHGQEYSDMADENRRSIINLPTQRGTIYDRNGIVLAKNVASYNIIITPAYLPADEGSIQGVYRKLAQIIDLPASRGELTEENVRLFKPCNNNLGISQIVYIADSLAPYEPVRVKCNVSELVAMRVKENKPDMPGVDIEVEGVRDYPTGELTAEIIGYLGPVPEMLADYYEELGFDITRDKVGYSGIELWMQEELGGKNGSRNVEVDSAGKIIRDLEAPIPITPGSNVNLTIDTRLQNAVKHILKRDLSYWNEFYKFNQGLEHDKFTKAAVIVEDIRTGEILSLVSYPSYENNRMARQIPGDYYMQLANDPNRPLFNYAIQGEYPPGSVFKMAPALGILNEHIVTAEQEIDAPGKITILQKFTPNDPGTPRDYVCWIDKQGGAHGKVNYYEGIAWSCDVYWYKVGGGYEREVPEGLNIWRIGEYAKAIGYNERTGIELPGEASGLIPDPNWKRVNMSENWSTGDTYIATMGQGYILSTPLQVLVSIATIANEGKYMKPTLLKSITDNEGKIIKQFEPVLVRDITKDPVITVYDENQFATEKKITVDPWVLQQAMIGMRMVTIPGGTAELQFEGMEIPTGGKTGTAEYCDAESYEKGECQPGHWPAHAWYVGFAPYDNPEIAVVAFVYDGEEGSTMSGPIVRSTIEAYFKLKKIDSNIEDNTP